MPNNSKQTFQIETRGNTKRLTALTRDRKPSWKRYGDGSSFVAIDVRLPCEINIHAVETYFASAAADEKRNSSREVYVELDLKASRALYELLKEHFEGAE